MCILFSRENCIETSCSKLSEMDDSDMDVSDEEVQIVAQVAGDAKLAAILNDSQDFTFDKDTGIKMCREIINRSSKDKVSNLLAPGSFQVKFVHYSYLQGVSACSAVSQLSGTASSHQVKRLFERQHDRGVSGPALGQP